MTVSTYQQRWLDLWGVGGPETVISLTLDASIDDRTMAARLGKLAAHTDGALAFPAGSGRVATNGSEDGSAERVAALRWSLTPCDAGWALELRAPSLVVDASSACELVSTVLANESPPELSYGEFASWARETLALRHEDEVTRWDGAEELLRSAASLPWGSPSEPRDIIRRRVPIPVPTDLLGRLSGTGEGLGISVADLLCAAWLTLLGRWLDVEAIVLGETADGRSMPEFHGIIGLLERTLPLRFAYEGTLPFARFARWVAKERKEAKAFQDYCLLPAAPGSSGYLPLGFCYRRFSRLGELTGVTAGAVESLVEPFALQLEAHDLLGTLNLSLNFDAALLRDGEVEAISRSLVELLADVDRHTAAPLNDLSLGHRTGPAARRRADLELGVWARFQRAVAAEPHLTAVTDGQASLTYEQLATEAVAISGDLAARALRPGDHVALRMPASVPAVAAILGVIHAGGAYVPVDPSLPPLRAEFILEDSGASMCIEPAPGGAGVVVRSLPSPKRQGGAVEHSSACAYVMYTSGSTASPKGVAVPEVAITSLVDALGPAAYDQEGPGLRVALLASLSFDASVQQVFAALLRGHTLVIVDPSVKRDPLRLCRYLREQRVDVADATPSLFELLVMHAGEQLDDLPVRRFLIGGETFSARTARRFYELGGRPDVRLVNVYGLTECGVDSTAMPVDEAYLRASRRDVPIGSALDNAEVLLLDPAGRAVPCGAVGEICIGGPGLAHGYLNDESLTRQRFRTHPFRPGDRLFHTGDRGWRDSDGLIHFLGRRDDQVKVRGHRVDVGEIRLCVLAHPGVQQALVLPRRTPEGDTELAAFFVANEPIGPVALRQHLRSRLPDFMRPRHVVQVDDIPLTVTNKADRDELLAQIPLLTSRTLDQGGGLVGALTRIFRTVLDDDAVQAGDDFFDVGGHSILALRAVSMIAKELSMRIELRTLYQHATPNALAEALESQERPDRGRVVPLRPAQPDGRNVFLLPPAFGASVVFRDLAQRLPRSYNPWGMDYGRHGELVEGSIEELSASLLAELEGLIGGEAAPLVGYSLGAAVAFELARQLEALDHRTGLVLIDRMLEPPRLAERAPSMLEGHHAEARTSSFRDAMISLADSYRVNGTVRCPVVALEAGENPIAAGMKSWRPHAKGPFRCAIIPGRHETVLAPENLPALSRELERSLDFITNR